MALRRGMRGLPFLHPWVTPGALGTEVTSSFPWDDRWWWLRAQLLQSDEVGHGPLLTVSVPVIPCRSQALSFMSICKPVRTNPCSSKQTLDVKDQLKVMYTFRVQIQLLGQKTSRDRVWGNVKIKKPSGIWTQNQELAGLLGQPHSLVQEAGHVDNCHHWQEQGARIRHLPGSDDRRAFLGGLLPYGHL